MVIRWQSFALFVALGASVGCHRAAPAETSDDESHPVHVDCVAVASQPVRDVRTMRGSVVTPPDHDAVIAPQIPGRIVRLAVREGDAVRAGAIVAEIESQPAQDALLQARAQLDQVRAQLANATITRERSQHLFERGIAARQEVDDATARQRESRASLEAASAAVSLAARNVARAQVRSPIDGVVVRIVRRGGELVDGTPATPVLEVADVRTLEFVASATTGDLMALHPGLSAEIRFEDASAQPFAATVRSVSPAIDPTTGLGQVRLTIAADARHPPLGTFGTASVQTGEHAALAVPSGAVRGAGSSAQVVACDGDHARVRSVTTGARIGDLVEVTQGLAASDRVVQGDAVLGLTEGAAIVAN